MNERRQIALMAVLAAAGLAFILLGAYIALSPPAAEPVFDGVYVTAFEVSVFYPDADPCRLELHQQLSGYWLAAEPASGFFERLRELSPGAPPDWKYLDGVVVHTRFAGQLSPPGKYGHLGLYAHEVTVVEVLEMDFPADCPAPAAGSPWALPRVVRTPEPAPTRTAASWQRSAP